MSLRDYFFASICEDFDRWPLWLPVFFGLGVSLYFSFSFEPNIYWAYTGILLFFISLWKLRLQAFSLIFLCMSVIALGFSLSLLRTHFLGTQMLHYIVPPCLLKGKVNKVDLKSTKNGALSQRLLLTDLTGETKDALPQKIRIHLKGQQKRLWPGDVIALHVKLFPVFESFLPGGFDFRRQAYFQGLGGTGFALSKPKMQNRKLSFSHNLEKKREEITAFFLERMSLKEGSIASALITGNKETIPEDIRENFINSGLAHILAISGLHLTIIAGVVFVLIRRGFSIFPPLCLAYNTKKIAALGTILMTFLYLVLSGFGVPAQRAFIMITIVMGSIVIDRIALSIRTVAIAASLILITTPEALLGPSFQLSFAAVIGLIAGYETWKNPLEQWVLKGRIFRKLFLYGGGLIFTSLLATIATLPFTVYIFHRFSLHAIEANLIAIPLISLIIMPAAFLTCLLMPLGLGEGPLWIFQRSIRALISIASVVSSWPGSNIPIGHPPQLSFVAIILGSLWLCLWQQPWRRWGFFPIIVGMIGFFWNQPSYLLIDGQGKISGLYQDKILYLNSLKKGKFVAQAWQKHFAAKEIRPLSCKDGVCKVNLEDIPVIISSKKETQPCLKGAILIRLEPSQQVCSTALLTIDWFDLWRGGSHLIWKTSKGLHMEKVRPNRNHRPWERKALSRKQFHKLQNKS